MSKRELEYLNGARAYSLAYSYGGSAREWFDALQEWTQ